MKRISGFTRAEMTIIRKPDDKKKKLLDFLKELSIIETDFTGKLVLNITQGGMQSLEKTENLKI